MNSSSNRQSAFTKIGLVSILALLCAGAYLLDHNYRQQRSFPRVHACIANLRQIDGAKGQWALEHHKVDTDTITTSDVASYLRGNVLPVCPAGGTYKVTTVSAYPTCTIKALGHSLSP